MSRRGHTHCQNQRPDWILRGIVTVILFCGCGSPRTNDTKLPAASQEALERTTEKGPVTLKVRLTPREPRLSDLVEMDVTVSAQHDVDIIPPAFGQSVGDFLVRDYSERGDSSAAASSSDGRTRHFHYQLEPTHGGHHLIRSIAIEFVDNRPLSEQRGTRSAIESEPIDVNVTSEFGDNEPNLADLEPMLPPRPLDENWKWVWLIVVLGLGLLTTAILWRRRRSAILAIEPRRQTPEEIAHAALTELLADQLPEHGLFKEFYLRLTDIVRHYIEGTTGLRAPEQTTEEFLREMRSRDLFSLERSNRLKEFLEAADMVKYAGQQPGMDQIDVSIFRAREFVSSRAADVLVPTVSTGED